MSRITFNVAAKCDKAGRAQNQDNYWVCPNLDKIGDTASIGNDSDVELSSKGALLVVADGMGGMKSGEKASEFVIEGIKSKFSNIPTDIFSDDNSIIAFIKDAIIESDKIIKSYAKDHRESEGMGSTIVLLWLLGEKAYCGWCGDSRIYCYNPQNSLVRLSHDHSYVQSLVDEGKITEEEAFDHPDGNIITRSLGDSGEAANPETKIYPIHRRDVFMLCSDGLCGLLNDEQIENILADNCTSSEDALKALWAKGQQEGWSDNATIEVACITDGGVTPTRKAAGYDDGKPKPVISKNKPIKKDTNVLPNFWQTNKQYILIIGIVAVVAIGIIWFFSRDKKIENPSNQEFTIEQQDNPVNQNEDVQHPEQPSTPNNGVTPQKPNQTVHPQKPNQPQKPNKPQKPNQPQNPNNDGEHGQQPNNPVQPLQPELPQRVQVTEGFLGQMRDTYNSIGAINRFISNAQQRRHFTSAEANALVDFQANAQDLNSKPDVKALDANQQKILNQINAIAKKAGQALRTYKIYDEQPSIQQQFQQQQQGEPGRGVQHTNPIEDPIYQNV